MEAKKFARGQKRVQVPNALREVEEGNRVGRYRTVPYPCAVEKLSQAELIDTSPDIAVPKWRMHQTKCLIRSTKRYRVRTFYPNSLPQDSVEDEIEKGLTRPVVTEDIPITPDSERQDLLKLVRRNHALGRRILTKLRDVPQLEELSATLRQWEELLEPITQNGSKQLRLYL
jgi:hypothetical protein